MPAIALDIQPRFMGIVVRSSDCKLYIPLEDLFITPEVWSADQGGYENVLKAFDKKVLKAGE